MKHKPYVTRIQNPKRRRARAEMIVTANFKGIPADEIGKAFGVTGRTVQNELHYAEREGITEKVINRLRDLMDKVPGVYEGILSASAADLADGNTRRAEELRLKAAESLSRAVGPHRPQSVQVKERRTLDLEEFFKLRATRRAEALPAAEVIDAEPATGD